MKFFIDTANIDEIKEAAALGILDGVTTNPSLIVKEIERTGSEFKQILKTICDIVQGPVSGEVISLETEGMVIEGLDLVKVDKHIVVKIPMTTEGLKAVKRLSDEGVKTNVTLVFSAIIISSKIPLSNSHLHFFFSSLSHMGQCLVIMLHPL